MADEEAEQERLSRGGGGCAAELQRLGERLQELERQLRESRVPAVEAATEYCQQLCQVRAPGVPSPFPPVRGGRGRASAWRPCGGPRCFGTVCAAARAGAGEYEEGAFVWLPLWRLLSAAPGWGKGVVVRAENPPSPSLPRTRDCAVPAAERCRLRGLESSPP